MKKKIQKKYHDHGFGFPVTILNAPMIQVKGEWVLDINQKELQFQVIEALVLKHGRLSGNEIHFIRLFSEMTLKQFAERFDVTHPAVLKWEKFNNDPTGMNWTTEKDIRLFALKKINPKPKNFIEAYEKLSAVATLDSEIIEIDMKKIAA